MHRFLLDKLKNWLDSPQRKPLILRGARQVGKTWLVRELAKQANKDLVELNFEKRRDLAVHFDSNEPSVILRHLEAALGRSIHSENSILFLDEIQAVPELIAKLRWFYESKPELPVIVAGSLLEFVLEDYEFSMPVGRINYFFVEPLSFEEFLLAKSEQHLLKAIQACSLRVHLNISLHEKANQLFKEYMLIGGMPEAVAAWVHSGSLESVSMVHHDLMNTYKDDFSKYSGRLSIQYLEEALQAVPKFLTKKIIYSNVHPTAAHSSIKKALELLTKARLCHKVQSVSGNGIPIGAETKPKNFKMILIDIGLTTALLGINLYQFKTMDQIICVNKGALTEQVVGQLLRLLSPYYAEPSLYYWMRDAQSSSAEIDYLIQYNDELIPVEVKAGSEGKLRSLHQFMFEKKWKTAIRFYAGKTTCSQLKTQTTQGNPVAYQLMSLPFYLIGQTARLLEE